MKLLAIGLETDVDLADCSRNPYGDKNFTAYNMSLYPMPRNLYSSSWVLQATVDIYGDKYECRAPAACSRVDGFGAGLKSEPGVAVLFNEAQRLRVDRNYVSVFRELAEGEKDISTQGLQTTKDLRRRQQQPPA